MRKTGIAAGEAGGITQCIGASCVPTKTIENMCGQQLKKMGIELTIPGLLFIDTPGHEAFNNLRKRGGSIADVAVLIVDITEGLQPQTKESIEILKMHKVPFIVAANKIDRLFGWHTEEGRCFMKAYKDQKKDTQQLLDEAMYKLMGQLHKLGFTADRFDHVDDFTKQIAIIPISAKTKEGLPELLMLISGLTQRFMAEKLETTKGPGKGTILEVKEVTGLGTTIDVILYEGSIKKGDSIVLGGKNGPIKTHVRALLQPKPLKEIQEDGKKFEHVQEVHASAGVRINAPSLDEALAGSSVIVADKNEEELESRISEELEQAQFSTEASGVVLKADTLGSLEAIIGFLKKEGIPVRKAAVGSVNKQDVIEAYSAKEAKTELGIVLAFNTKVLEEAKKEAEDKEIKILSTNIIYKMLEDYEEWKKEEREKEKKALLESATYPAKIRLIPGYVFRKSKPVVCGIEILEGTLKSPCPLMNEEGKRVGKIKEIQDKNETIDKAEPGMQVAASITNVTIGRQIHEGDVLYSHIPLTNIYKLEKEIKEKELLKEIKKIKRRVKTE